MFKLGLLLLLIGLALGGYLLWFFDLRSSPSLGIVLGGIAVVAVIVGIVLMLVAAVT